MRRSVLTVGLIVAAAAAGVYAYQWLYREPALVLTGVVTTDEVVVSSQIAGRIDSLRVKQGDTVAPGQLVATIKPEELKAAETYYAQSEQSSAAQVREAEANLKYQELQTRDQIRQAEAALESTKSQQAVSAANLENARLEYERAGGLFKQGIVSAQAHDQARTTFQAAEAQVESLRKQVEAQQAAAALARATEEEIVMRESQLLAGRHQWAAAAAQKEKARVVLGYTEIRAPIGGSVDGRVALQGEVVNPGQAILTLIDPDDLWVRADVEETYIERIRLGDRMTVRFPSGLERTGTVFFRGVDADFATQRDVSRVKRDIKTFEIRLRVDNSDRRLHPGLTAYVEAPLKTG